MISAAKEESEGGEEFGFLDAEFFEYILLVTKLPRSEFDWKTLYICEFCL